MANFEACRLRSYSVVDFYNHINLLYGSITEFCSPQSCPEMKATDEYATTPFCRTGPDITRFEYLWQDSENYKRPTKMPAPTYIEHLMGWVQSNIDNESVFPSRIGNISKHDRLPIANRIRSSVPQVLPKHDSASLQANVPRLCPHILPSLPRCSRTGTRGASQY